MQITKPNALHFDKWYMIWFEHILLHELSAEG